MGHGTPAQRRALIEQHIAPGGAWELTEVDIGRGAVRAYAGAPRSIRQLYTDNLSDATFIVDATRRWTFAEAWADASRLGRLLVEDLGVQPGDRVAISGRNHPEWMLAFCAATSVGAIAVAMNSLWNDDEMAYGLDDSGATVLFADAERLQSAAASGWTGYMVGFGPGDLSGAIDVASLLGPTAPAVDMPQVDIAPDDPALILYTSGSTGHPKGVLTTHRNVVSALLTWELEYTVLAERDGVVLSPPETAGYGPAILLGIPLFHVLGLHGVYLASLRSQRKVVTMMKWDPDLAVELIERERIVTITAPPAVTGDLARAAARGGHDLSSLVSVGGGGAARTPDQVRQIDDTFDTAVPNTGWGMTETSAIGTLIFGQDYLAHPLSSGPALAVVDLRVVDDDGAEVPTGERGELQVRGVMMFREYWNKPSATADAHTDDGWFRTGDVALIDADGHLHIVDRIKDLIIRGGENIGCGTVENAVDGHPEVIEAVAYAVPDERLGEEVGITVYGTAVLDVDDLLEFCRGRLARHEVPRYVTVHDGPLPRTGSGKLLRRDLRDAAVAAMNHG